jgi:hypothetical protein
MLIRALIRPMMTEVDDMLFEHVPKMPLPKDEKVILALAANATDKSFAK